MKHAILTILCSCIATLPMQAQTTEWNAPHVGYSNTRNLSIEKVTFGRRATEVHAVIAADYGTQVTLSSGTKLKTANGDSRITKVSKLKLDKKFIMPDSGKVHIVMSFEAMPAVPDVMHFIESDADRGWKLAGIRPDKDKTKETWGDMSYIADPDLPFSYFCDDSTAVNVKILNYMPDAARDIRFTYDKVDIGNTVYNERYPISDDGTATIKLHPCFPISAFMSVGDGPHALIMLVPGKDITVLIDMDEAKDGLGIKGFKGAYAKMHYEVNVKGGKDLVSYNTSTSYFESLLQSDKQLMSQTNEKRQNTHVAITTSKFSEPTKHFLRIYNNYSYLHFGFILNNYIYGKLEKFLSEASYRSLRSAIGRCDFLGDSYVVENEIFPKDYITLCPLFSTAVQYNPPFDTPFYQDVDGNVSLYNKSVIQLHTAIGYYLSLGETEAERYGKQITSPELKVYYATVIERWKQKVKEVNDMPHIHFYCFGESIGKDMRKELLNEYKGKTVVFVAYNKSKSDSVRELDRFVARLTALGRDDIVLLCMDLDIDQGDYSEWYRFSSTRPGEHYVSTFRIFGLLFSKKFTHLSNGCYYEVYTPEGQSMVNTSDSEKVMNSLVAK